VKLLDRLFRLLGRETQPDDPLDSRVFVPRLQAGMNVTHDTAMQLAAVYRAVAYISSQIAMMPWRVMLESNGRKELRPSHPVDKMLNRLPNQEMTAYVFRETLIAHALTWGNGYAEIVRDRSNRPTELWPIPPDRVQPKRIDGQVVYEISNSREGKSYLSQNDVYHLPGLGYDGLVGYSVITLAARSIGLGMASEQFGSSFFQNGTTASGVLQHPGELGAEAVNNLRESWNETHRGPGNANKPIILEEGMTWKQISIPPDDAQFLQTRQFQVDEIARWYGLPPHKLQSMENATFSNIEHQSIEVVTDSLQPWATRLEQEADRKLFSGRELFYTNIDMTELLRGDVNARTTYYRELWNLGAISVNEIRLREGFNPIGEEGDKHLVQMNLTTLEKAGENEAEPEQEVEPVEEEEESLEMHVVFEVCNRIARRERHRVVDATQRYNDRTEFIDWMNKFFSQHRKYSINALQEAGIENPFVDAHIRAARLNMLRYYDDGIDYPVDGVAQTLTENFIKVA